MHRHLYAWGFEEAELLRAFPSDLLPVCVGTAVWPQEDLLVVSGHAVTAFQRAAMTHTLPDGRLPEAILYVPRDVQLPADAWVYFDLIIQEGDVEAWETVRALLRCPAQLHAAELANRVPARWLASLTRPLITLQPDELPLPDDARRLLKSHSAYWQVFLEELAARQELRESLVRHAASVLPLEKRRHC